MAPGGTEDGSGLPVKQEPTAGLSERPQVPSASGEAVVGKPSCALDDLQPSADEAGMPAGAAEPAAAANGASTGVGQGQQLKRKREDAPSTQATEADAEALRERLGVAAARFAALPQKPQLWLEANLAARLGPFEMVGRTVRIHWPADDAWYLGTIASYNESTGKHLIRYADNAEEWEVLAVERVRLLVTAGEPLARPDSGTLRRHAAALRRVAGEHQSGAQLRKRADELEAIAEQPQPEAEAQARAAAEEQARAAAIEQQRRQQQPQCASCGSSGAAMQSAPDAGAAQGGTVAPRLAACLPSVSRAMQQAALLPHDAPLRGVRLVNNKYHVVRVSVDRVRKDLHAQSAAAAAVAADVYAMWWHVVRPERKTGKPMELNVLGAGYQEDSHLLEQLRGLHDALSIRDWLRALLSGEQDEAARQPEHQQPPDGQQQAAAGPGAAAPEATAPMAVDGEEEEGSAVPDQQPQAQGTAEEQQMQLECGPDLSADQQASQLQQCRGQHEAAPVQPADQKQQPGTLCAALQQLSDGSEPAMNGDMTSEEAAGGAKGGSAAPAAHAAPPQQQQLLPGEVGWFQVKGYPHWPFLVVTREEAAARGVPAAQLRNPAFLPVQYFGPGEVQCINLQAVERVGKRGEPRPCFAAFLEGLERGYHRITRCRRASDFKRALFEVEQYFNTGELPLVMKPHHNDGHGAQDDDDDDEEPAAGKPAAKRRKGKKAAGAEASLPLPGLPFHVNQHLQVLELGEVEWLHPAFHNEKCIFPVGYRARRIASTPAAGREAPHTLEVLRAPDGSGPLFRVTPEGCPAVEGPTATKAWQGLYPGDATSKARVADVSGNLMFGLSSSRVQRAIRALPGARRCDRYCGWPEGEEPEAAPLSEEEKRERLACQSRMQKLAEGIEPVPAAPSGTHCVCHVCGEDDEEEQDQQGLILSCARCRMHVHSHCYYLPRAPPLDQPWLCDPCSLGLGHPPPCALCPVLGGALKRTSCGRWAHPTCALWLPETHVDEEARELHMQGVVRDLHKVRPVRFTLKCQFCKQQNAGACMQCCEPKCFAAFHPLCARQAGCRVPMEFVWSDDEEPEEGQGEEEGAPAPQQRQQEARRGASGDENDAAATNGSAREPMSRSGRGKASQQKQQQGTRRDRLLFRAFCPKHSRERYPPAAAPAAGAKRPYEQQRQQQQQQPALLQAPCSAARAVPFNPAARRGQRAPEAEAAALAKRQFMRATPYLVGLPMQSGAAELPESVCHLRPPTAAAVKKPETAAAAGEQQQEHTEQERQEQHQQPEEQQQQAQEQPQADEPQQRERRQQQPWFPGTLLTVDAEGGQPGSPPAGQQRVGWRPIRGLQSEADRFAKMVATQGQRVTIGKSAIHGWGGFAKRAHRAHDMVIEYVGELVRHSVSDLRERRLYDATVGAGTYVFRLNGQWCVDATRAGNLAHMLNHSCSPNCYSRTISILLQDGTVTDHVILFALRDIVAGEELTYNYRFCGREQLRCNCGAPACTGLVNERPPDHDRPLVPRCQLKPYLQLCQQPDGPGATASAADAAGAAAATPNPAEGGPAAAGDPAAGAAGGQLPAADGGGAAAPVPTA